MPYQSLITSHARRNPVSAAAEAMAAEHNRQRRKRKDRPRALAFTPDGALHTVYMPADGTAVRYPDGTIVTVLDSGPLTPDEAQRLLEQDGWA